MKICAHINQIDKQKWELLLEQSSFVSPFQTPTFFNFYNSLETSSADVFVVEDNGEYVALVLVTLQEEPGVKGYFSRRGIVYGGVVFADKAEESTTLLFSYLKTYYKKKLIYLEIRNNFDYSPYKADVLTTGFTYIPWFNYQLTIINSKLFRDHMSKSRQRQLNKALKNGVTWREASSIDDIKTFYHILAELYVHKVKKPLPSFEFFVQLYETSFAKCLIVEKNDIIIGGVMCPIYGHDALYELYICGKDKDYPNAHPSIVAMWAMVEYAEKNKVSKIDLMGAGRVDKPSSVRDFKSKFGGELVENGRFIYKCNPFLYALGSFYLKIKAKL